MPKKIVTEVVSILGPAIAKALIATWTGGGVGAAIGTSLVGWISSSLIPDLYKARRAARLIEEIADEIASSLAPFIEVEFRNLSDNQRTAVIHAVATALEVVDLKPQKLVDLDIEVHRIVGLASNTPKAVSIIKTLSLEEEQLFGVLLEQTTARIVELISRLPTFSVAVYTKLLVEGTALREAISEVAERARSIEASLNAESSRVDEFERKYRQALARRLDQIQLFGASVETRHYPLTLAYIPLDTDSESGESPIGEVLADSTSLYIRGGAGSGKTTLLQWLAVRMAAGDLNPSLNIWANRIPFFIRLRAFSRTKLPPPEEWVSSMTPAIAGAMPYGWVHKVLEENRAAILIDGVDELSSERRPELVTWLKSLRDFAPESPVVLSARPLADELKNTDIGSLKEVRLQPMRPKGVQVFIERWHKAVAEEIATPDERTELLNHQDTLIAQLNERPALGRLAQTPLLCAIICAVNRDRRGFLPTDRQQLYEQCCEMFLDRRDKERGIHSQRWNMLSYKQKKTAVAELAWWMVRNDIVEVEFVEADRQLSRSLRLQTTVKDMSGAEFRRILVERSGLVRSPIPNVIDFAHKSFLEYLAAVAALEHDDLSLVSRNSYKEGWRELTLLASSMARPKEREKLINKLISNAERYQANRPTRALLGLACIEEASHVSTELRERAERVVNRLELPRSNSEVASWISAGELAISRLRQGASEDVEIAESCLRALSGIATSSALEALAPFAQRKEPQILAQLFKCWNESGDQSEVLAKEWFSDAEVSPPILRIQRGLRYIPSVTHVLGIADVDSLDELAHCHEIRVMHLKVPNYSAVRMEEVLPSLINLNWATLALEPGYDKITTSSMLETLLSLPSISEIQLWLGSDIDAELLSVGIFYAGSAMFLFGRSQDGVPEFYDMRGRGAPRKRGTGLSIDDIVEQISTGPVVAQYIINRIEIDETQPKWSIYCWEPEIESEGVVVVKRRRLTRLRVAEDSGKMEHLTEE